MKENSVSKNQKNTKSNIKEDKKVFLTIPVPFHLKHIAVDLGAECVPVNERQTGQSIWYVHSEKEKNKIEEKIQEYMRDDVNQERTELEENIEPEKTQENVRYTYIEADGETSQSVNDKMKKVLQYEAEHGPIFSVHIETIDKEFDWDEYLSKNWNALDAVQKLKEKGLPLESKHRIKILENFRNGKEYHQYNVVYEDLCEYCEEFNKAYGWKVLKKALNFAKIQTGYNFDTKVSHSNLPDEIKCALRFAFPIVYREKESNYVEEPIDNTNTIQEVLDKYKEIEKYRVEEPDKRKNKHVDSCEEDYTETLLP